MIASKMREKQLPIETGEDLLAAFDSRKTGFVTLKDFIQGCEGLGLAIQDADLRKVFAIID